MLRVYLFGGLVVMRDKAPLPPIAGAVPRSLFAYLLTYRDRPHTRDLLAGTFWPDLPDDVARRRLSQALWQIRAGLDPDPVLLAEGDTVQINPELPLWLDVEQFAKHQSQSVAEGTTDDAKAMAHCELCLEQYRGDFLAGYYEDWLFPERERLREQYLDVLERLVVGHKRQGDYTAALAHARRLATEDPLREEAHREIMRLDHLLGRDVEALHQFETCRQVLAEELGVEPSPETRNLAHEIAEHSGRVAPVDLPPVAPTTPAFILDSPEVPDLPLVGRETERAEILDQMEALFQGLGGLLLLEGETGVGKTRLLRAIADDARWRGAEVLWGGARQSEAATPYGPLVEALSAGLSPLRARQLAQVIDRIWLQVMAPLLPALVAALPHLDPPPPLEPTQERDRLVHALAQLLTGWAQVVPLLLVIENLHWAGQDTLDLLARLAPLLGESGVLVIGSYRGEEPRARPETWQALQALDRAGVCRRLALDRLSAAAAGELVRRCLGMGIPAPLFEARLFGETAGNPLFLLETLRTLHSEGLLFRNEDGQWSTPWDDVTNDYAELPLPPVVEQIIARRVNRLPPSLRRTAQLAAIQGERFDFDLLCAASGEEPSGLLAALRVLVQRRFLDETEQDYRFHHDKIRQVAYESIEVAHRPQLHRRVAEALESLQPPRVAALAHHWSEAEVWDKAAAFHRQAGDRAAELYANAEAVEHYTQALAALDRVPGTVDPGARYDILLAREAIHDLQGQREAQADDLKALEALVQGGDHATQEAGLATQEDPVSPSLARRRVQVALNRAQYTMAMVDYTAAVAMVQEAVRLAKAAQITELEAEGYYHWGSALWRLGQWDQARQKLDELLEMARRGQLHDLEAKALGLLTHLAVEQGEYAQARLLGEQALNLFRKHKDRRGESGTHRSIGLAAAWEGDYVAAESHQKQSLGLAREIGYLSGQGMALSGLGIIAAEQGTYVEARSYYDQALRIFGRTGDRDQEGRILNNLGFILDQMGAYAEAEDHFERVLANSRDIGSRHGEVVALVNLAQVANQQGRNQEALELGQQALAHAEEIGERRAQGYAWTIVGDTLARLGRLADAESAYRRSLALRRELGQANLAPEALAGLVRLALTRKDLRQACAFTDEVLEHLKTGSLGGSKDPMLVYLSCYRALHAVHDARAPRILAEAYGEVQEQAARITDDRLRRGYLENVEAHREIVAAYAAWQSRSQRAVRLPRADAPTGRPLRDDEYVTVTWTVAAPEDEALKEGSARRQALIQRLLQEAAGQGATPTVGDLAAALAVSEPTVRRDLAALRRAGHPVQTRGSREG